MTTTKTKSASQTQAIKNRPHRQSPGEVNSNINYTAIKHTTIVILNYQRMSLVKLVGIHRL